MKLIKMLEYIDTVKPNAYAPDIKIAWLSDLDKEVFENVISTKEDYVPPTRTIERVDNETGAISTDVVEYSGFVGYEYGRDEQKELLIPSPYSDLYLYYVAAKIDFNNRETESYANNMIMYNTLFDSFCAYYTRNHMPKQKASIRV